ncbi:MAG: hypothetical protein IPK21_23435 [Haliscomenobacter sp.]|nr:hypothetical protein [Haliscomenobacter sp.]
MNDEFHCTLKVGELRQLVQAVNLLQDQIPKRMEERAAFFYALELRKANRTGQPPVGNLEYFRAQEKENLPQAVKAVLEIGSNCNF